MPTNDHAVDSYGDHCGNVVRRDREAKATFEWLEGGQLLLVRSTVEMPEAPDGVCIYGCDAANGTYYQLYTDDRNVCRVYQMSIGNGEWKL